LTIRPLIRPITGEDHAWVLALNAAHEVETGPLDAAALAAHIARAAHAAVAEPEAGFLLAFAPGAGLTSPNFRWFAARMPNFLYIDRIVVAAPARGRGLATALYTDAAAAAGRLGLTVLVAEVNLDPPNPTSLAFHEKAGFTPVGEARLEGRGKTVRYLSRRLG
jgi:predicted GNAT superfamily acetyltransferase